MIICNISPYQNEKNDIYLHMHVIYTAHSIGLQVIENSLHHYLNDNHAATLMTILMSI